MAAVFFGSVTVSIPRVNLNNDELSGFRTSNDSRAKISGGGPNKPPDAEPESRNQHNHGYQ
jgi:hypothetical protein